MLKKEKVRILHISDIHNNFEGLGYRTDVDVVVNTGDAQCHTREEFFAFLEWFEKYPIKDKIYVAGNHDIFIDTNKAFCENLFKERGIIYLSKNSVTLHGLKFYGEPMSPRYGLWSFMADRNKMHKHWNYIPEDVHILLTHTPPKGVLDLSENRIGELEMCGCSALNKRIKNLPNLKLHCFGHIHNFKHIVNTGLRIIDGVTFSNATAVTDSEFDKGITFKGNIIEL